MIIFYNKKTGDVIGTVEGRVHDDDTVNNAFVCPSNMDTKDIGKYIVPFKEKTKMVEENIEELRVTNKKTGKVEKVVIGKKMVKKSAGLMPDGVFADHILKFEDGTDSVYKYKLILDGSGAISSISRKNSNTVQ